MGSSVVPRSPRLARFRRAQRCCSSGGRPEIACWNALALGSELSWAVSEAMDEPERHWPAWPSCVDFTSSDAVSWVRGNYCANAVESGQQEAFVIDFAG